MNEWDNRSLEAYANGWTVNSIEPAQPANPKKCSCCGEDYSQNNGEITVDVNSKRARFCIECQQDYINKNVEDFKKFMSLRKIQLGK